MKSVASAPPDLKPVLGKARQRAEAGNRTAAHRAQGRARCDESAGRRGRYLSARPHADDRPSPSAHDRPRADRGDLHAPGVSGARRPRNRGRLPQLRSAQHARRASCPRHAGHAVSLRRGCGSRTAGDAAPHAHLADADPLHGEPRASGADHRARQGLPPRRPRSDAHADVSAGRRPRGRRRHHDGRFEGHAHGVCA